MASGRFALDEGERKALAKLSPLLSNVRKVEVTRHYSWKLVTQFNPEVKVDPVPFGELRGLELGQVVR